MKKLLAVAIIGLLFTQGCASLAGPRHGATVTVVAAHSTLSAVQDTELLLVCEKPGAPAAPLCVDAEKHKAISAKLATAFALDGDLARLVRAVPLDQPQPPQVAELVARIAQIINDVLALIPKSPQKAALEQNLAGSK